MAAQAAADDDGHEQPDPLAAEPQHAVLLASDRLQRRMYDGGAGLGVQNGGGAEHHTHPDSDENQHTDRHAYADIHLDGNGYRHAHRNPHAVNRPVVHDHAQCHVWGDAERDGHRPADGGGQPVDAARLGLSAADPARGGGGGDHGDADPELADGQ